jgi:hypothetical protein
MRRRRAEPDAAGSPSRGSGTVRRQTYSVLAVVNVLHRQEGTTESSRLMAFRLLSLAAEQDSVLSHQKIKSTAPRAKAREGVSSARPYASRDAGGRIVRHDVL